MDIDLTYGKGLLRAIGGVPITYGEREWMDTTPRALGAWALEYQRFSSTLRAVGGVEITYRRWSSLPRTVGQWTCEHRRSRLESIGPYALRHDQAGRVSAIGPLQIFYDRGGSDRAVLAEADLGRVQPSQALTDVRTREARMTRGCSGSRRPARRPRRAWSSIPRAVSGRHCGHASTPSASARTAWSRPTPLDREPAFQQSPTCTYTALRRDRPRSISHSGMRSPAPAKPMR